MRITIATPPSDRQLRAGGWLLAAGLTGGLLLGLPRVTYAQDTSSTSGQHQNGSQTSDRAQSTSTDSTKWGYHVERNPTQQNPPGYRGLERPAALNDSGAAADSFASADATSRVNQMKRQHAENKSDQQAARDSGTQDSTKWGYKVDRNPGAQNPPGYRGMERPASLDSAQRNRQAQAAPPERNGGHAMNRDATDARGRADAARASDSTSTVRMGQDSTGDSTRFGVNAQEQGSNSRRADAEQSRDSRGRDSVDIVHRQRQVAPGVGHEPPPYPPDSARQWVQQRPGNDSVTLQRNDSSSTTPQSNR